MVLGDHDVAQEGETEAVSYVAKEVRVHPGQNRRSLLKLSRNVLSLAVPKYFTPEVVFLNFLRAQESVLRNRFYQAM